MTIEYDQLEANAANFVELTPMSFLQRSADIYPQREALIYNQRRYSWAQLRNRCTRIASSLASTTDRRLIGRPCSSAAILPRRSSSRKRRSTSTSFISAIGVFESVRLLFVMRRPEDDLTLLILEVMPMEIITNRDEVRAKKLSFALGSSVWAVLSTVLGR